MQELKNINEIEILEHIESSIKEFGEKFINPKNKYAFFGSEGSVKCYLYHLIAQNSKFLEDVDYTKDDDEKITTWRLHSELNTFEKVNSKVGKFDICIINSDESYNDNLACIEIEWIKKLHDSNKELKMTLEKLSNKDNEIENSYLIILNDYKGFTLDDITEIRKLKQQYPKVNFFIFDTIKNAKHQF